jgi:aminoglycoside/choline kinase family phosphotransferase
MIGSLQKILVQLRGRGIDGLRLLRLAGDASNRTYHRATWLENGNERRMILMVLGHPEAFSEEATGAAPPPTTLPFIDVQRHLQTAGVAVPQVFHYDAPLGWLLLEDLGDTTLWQAVQGVAPDRMLHLYRLAITELLRIHRVVPTTSIASHRAFDESLFVWEFDHFLEYGIEARSGKAIPPLVKKEILGYFADLSRRFAMLPRVLTHRDYHSRNLMVQEADRLRVIDFQDALMGPCQYDLASLLRDSYIDLPEPMIDPLISDYLGGLQAQTGEAVDPVVFRENFDGVSFQRNLKAAGRFVYIDRVKKNPNFLPSVAPTLMKARATLLKQPRLARLHHLLADFVPEWQ